MEIYLKNDIIDNLKNTDSDISLYVALRSLYQSTRKNQIITYNMIMYELYGNLSYKRAAYEKIVEAFKRFSNVGLISIVEKVSNTEYIVDLSNLYFEGNSNNYYTVIRDEEIHTIMNINNKMDKFKLLRYFIVCLKSLCKTQGVYIDALSTKTDFVGFMPQKYLAEKMGSDYESNKKLIQQYDAVLEENHLLYIYRHKEMKRNTITGQFKSFTNHYGRYKDREDIITFAKNYEKVHGIEEQLVQSGKSNRKRSISAKYNNLCKDFDRYINQYSNDELIEIYKQIRHDNEQIQSDLIGTKVGSDYYEKLRLKLRDEEIFDKIPCIVQYHSRNIIKLNCENEDNWGKPDHIA